MSDMVVKPSSKPILPYYIFAGLIMISGAYLLIEVKPAYYGYVCLGLGVLIDLYAAMKHISLLATKLTIEGENVHVDTGFLTKASRSMPLRKLGDVHVEQTVMQRMLGLGNLSISAAGESTRHTIENIDSPQDVCDKILNSIPK